MEDSSPISVSSSPVAHKNGQRGQSTKWCMVRALPEVVLTTGLLIAWYVRWQTYHAVSVTFFGLAGLTLIGTNLLLKYYFASIRFARANMAFLVILAATHWLTQVTTLFDVGSTLDHYLSNLEDSANYVLLTSVAVKFIVECASRLCCQSDANRFGLWSFNGVMEFMGAYAACLLYGRHVAVLFCLLAALIMLISSTKLGSHWSLAILAFLIFSSERYTFVNLGISTNPYAIICFIARHMIGPIFDLAFCQNSRLQAWGEVLICAKRCTQKLFMFLAFIIQITLFVVLAQSVSKHKEWYIVVPMFSCVGVVWIVALLALLFGVHAVFSRFVLAARDAQSGQLEQVFVPDSEEDHSEKLKLSDDGSSIRDAKEKSHTTKLRQSLSAHGVRYLSLAIIRLAYLQFAVTTLLMLLCWTTAISARYSCVDFHASSTVNLKDAITVSEDSGLADESGAVEQSHGSYEDCEGHPCAPALFALAISILASLIELLSELSTNLGGTCVAYGVIAPPVQCRDDGLVTVLPPNFMQEAGGQSTRILQTLLGFMSQHMITNYGADWSMAATNLEMLQKKIADFLRRTTSEGPRFDTYLLYYSGPTNANGDWALSGGELMGLGKLLSLWKEANASGTSRLIIVCDCHNSHQWLRPIWRLDEMHCYVALQTYKSSGPVLGQDDEAPPFSGEFTQFWSDFNNEIGSSSKSTVPKNKIFRPLYAVSRRWTDFTFHLPTRSELTIYWLQILPRFCSAQPTLVQAFFSLLVAEGSREDSSFGIFTFVKRARIRFWPPQVIETGHGFKLIRG